MAAAVVIPLVLSAITTIGPVIPTVIKMLEDLFGGTSKTPDDKLGPVKMQTGVDLLTTSLTSLANAGKLPSAAVLDANLKAALQGAIQVEYDKMKADGRLTAPPVPAPVPPGGAAPDLQSTSDFMVRLRIAVQMQPAL